MAIASRKTSPPIDAIDAYEPRTELGKELLALRRAHLEESGDELLDWSGIEKEVASRRGGRGDRL